MMAHRKFSTAVLVLLLGAALGGCATTTARPRPPAAPSTPKADMALREVCAAHNITWSWDQIAQVVTLGYGGAEAKVLVGSDIVLVENQRVTLSAPSRTVKSTVMVARDFRDKVVQPLLREAQERTTYVVPRSSHIVIDAGHGGKDPGAIGRGGLLEKDVNLGICLELKKVLVGRGYRVTLTREDDTFLTLQERTQIASRVKADVFVSIHANASPSRKVHGLEIYSAEELGFDDRAAAQRRTNERLLFDELAMKTGEPHVAGILADMLYEHKEASSKTMAEIIGGRMETFLKAANRGAKEERFYVLRNTLVPAVLVEVGFLSNAREEDLLRSHDYRQKVALSLANGIDEFVNSR